MRAYSIRWAGLCTANRYNWHILQLRICFMLSLPVGFLGKNAETTLQPKGFWSDHLKILRKYTQACTAPTRPRQSSIFSRQQNESHIVYTSPKVRRTRLTWMCKNAPNPVELSAGQLTDCTGNPFDTSGMHSNSAGHAFAICAWKKGFGLYAGSHEVLTREQWELSPSSWTSTCLPFFAFCRQRMVHACDSIYFSDTDFFFSLLFRATRFNPTSWSRSENFTTLPSSREKKWILLVTKGSAFILWAKTICAAWQYMQRIIVSLVFNHRARKLLYLPYATINMSLPSNRWD